MFAVTSEFWQQSLQKRGRDAVVVASGIEEVEGRLLKKLLSGIYSPRMDIHGVTLIGESQKEEWRIHANPGVGWNIGPVTLTGNLEIFFLPTLNKRIRA